MGDDGTDCVGIKLKKQNCRGKCRVGYCIYTNYPSVQIFNSDSNLHIASSIAFAWAASFDMITTWAGPLKLFTTPPPCGR